MYELVRNSPLFLECEGDRTFMEVQPPESKKQKTDDWFTLKSPKFGIWFMIDDSLGEETRISWVLT